MKQRSKVINFPITENDFRIWGIMILNNDKNCCHCDGELEAINQIPFSSGIFYICKRCGKNFKKTNYTDFRTGESYFKLKEIRG